MLKPIKNIIKIEEMARVAKATVIVRTPPRLKAFLHYIYDQTPNMRATIKFFSYVKFIPLLLLLIYMSSGMIAMILITGLMIIDESRKRDGNNDG